VRHRPRTILVVSEGMYGGKKAISYSPDVKSGNASFRVARFVI